MVLHDKNSRLVRISSKDRSSTSNSQYDIIYDTNDYDMQLIRKVVLKSAIIPNTQYNVNIYNNVFKSLSLTIMEETSNLL
jgi:hypothetical protein